MAKSGILASERLALHPFNDTFLTQRYVGWLNDPLTVRYSEQRHRRHTIETCRVYAHSFNEGPHYFWAISASDTELGHIGNITATVDPQNRVADLAIMIGEAKARSLGLGLESWQRACRFLLEELRLRKVTAGTMATNTAMLRVMQGCGMMEDGRRRRQFLLDGQEVDLVMAALFASEHQ